MFYRIISFDQQLFYVLFIWERFEVRLFTWDKFGTETISLR